MAAVLLGWDPDRWNWDGLYPTIVGEVRRSGWHVERWPIGSGKPLPLGTEAWLFVHGGRPNQRGLIGHGFTVSEPSAASLSDPDMDSPRLHVGVEFDLLLPEGEQLRMDELVTRIPGVDWKTAITSGKQIPSKIEAAVRALWAEHVLDGASPGANTVDPDPGSYPEAALARVPTNRYERSPEARAVAIAHHGPNCHACGFDFVATYGTEGAGFIHVHHTVPASLLGSDYEFDPITDLVPLCPNCHYMAHRRRPTPYTVAELRAMIAAAGHLPGVVVTAEQQRAQDAALRITEARSVTD